MAGLDMSFAIVLNSTIVLHNCPEWASCSSVGKRKHDIIPVRLTEDIYLLNWGYKEP